MHAQLPGDIKLNYFDKESNMQEISIEELTKGKKASPLCLRCPQCYQLSLSLSYSHGAKTL